MQHSLCLRLSQMPQLLFPLYHSHLSSLGTLVRKCVRHNAVDFNSVTQSGVKRNRWVQLAAILKKYVGISNTASGEITSDWNQ